MSRNGIERILADLSNTDEVVQIVTKDVVIKRGYITKKCGEYLVASNHSMLNFTETARVSFTDLAVESITCSQRYPPVIVVV